MTMTYRPIDPQIEQRVAQAVAEHFIVDQCEECLGPRVWSKKEPLGKCFACGKVSNRTVARPTDRKTLCETCRKFFWTKVLYKNCPKCSLEIRRAKEAEKGKAAEGATEARNDQ